MKLHLGLDHAGLLPAFARVTDGKAGDVEAARALPSMPAHYMRGGVLRCRGAAAR